MSSIDDNRPPTVPPFPALGPGIGGRRRPRKPPPPPRSRHSGTKSMWPGTLKTRRWSSAAWNALVCLRVALSPALCPLDGLGGLNADGIGTAPPLKSLLAALHVIICIALVYECHLPGLQNRLEPSSHTVSRAPPFLMHTTPCAAPPPPWGGGEGGAHHHSPQNSLPPNAPKDFLLRLRNGSGNVIV